MTAIAGLPVWKVTRETAVLAAAWCLGTREADPIRVHVPTEAGRVTAPEGWYVVRYGTRNGAGLFWVLPPVLYAEGTA
jgi:hypothetical protein